MNEVMLKDVDVLDEVDEEKEGGLTVSDNFGIMLKHYRKLKNLSLKQLEEISGVSASYVNRLERGERKSPSITKILQLAEALEIRIRFWWQRSSRNLGHMKKWTCPNF